MYIQNVHSKDVIDHFDRNKPFDFWTNKSKWKTLALHVDYFQNCDTKRLLSAASYTIMGILNRLAGDMNTDSISMTHSELTQNFFYLEMYLLISTQYNLHHKNF